jgi:hypothetical protein
MGRDKRAGSQHGGWRIIAGRQGVFLCRKCLADDCKLFEEMLNSVRLVCSDHSFFDFWSRELWHRHLAVKLEDGCGCSCREEDRHFHRDTQNHPS